MAISPEENDEKKSSSAKRGRDRGVKKRAKLVDKAIESIEEKLSSTDVKASFADFIRLLQLQKELQVDQPREIKVTWIEPSETESASEE